MKKEISRLDVGSVAIMYGAILALIGLFFGILFAIFGSLFASFTRTGDYENGLIFGSGIAVVLIAPILYGVIGLIFGALFGVVYNFIAGRIGGVKVYIKE